MKKFIIAILFIIIAGTANTFAQSTISRSTITFHIKNMGIGTSGTFSGLQASVNFNPADLAKSTIDASVETSTLNSNNSSRDEHLKSEDFFDIAKYPKITLKSVSFTHKSGDNYTGKFNLTIKDKTKLIDMPFTYVQKDNKIAFKGTFKINRLDYGIGGNSLILADQATIDIDAEATK
ncbi:YceI family protein [Mucilaginibacter sp.]|uniref:YceI family protein n=1 Tax=Mucilaginibacter sp. TaxID=1882438 RepID=UPI003D0A006D